MKKVKKTLSLTPLAIVAGLDEAKETGTNFSWIVENLLRALSIDRAKTKQKTDSKK